MTNIKSPRVVMPKEVFEKIMYWVQKGGNHECSGLGVTEIRGSDLCVTDVCMVKQSNGGASTDMDPEGINKAMFLFRDHPGTLNYWWHSHADMGVFWSSTDTATIAQISQEGMCVASVFNKKREHRSAVASNSPFPFFMDQIELSIDPFRITAAQQLSWDKEYTDNVSENRFRGNIGYGGMGDYSDEALEQRWQNERQGWVQDPNTRVWVKREAAGLKPAATTGEMAPITQSPNGAITNIGRSESEILAMGSDVPDSESWADLDDVESRRIWGAQRDEIHDFHPIQDQYRLYDGTCVDARDYIKRIERIEGNRSYAQ